MRPWLRRILIAGALAGVVYAGFTVKIGGRPPFGHAYHWVKRSHPVRSFSAWLTDKYDAWFAHDDRDDDAPPARPTKKPDKAKPSRTPTRAEIEAAATPKRVALLESAAREAFPEDTREESPRAVDEKPEGSARTALHEKPEKPRSREKAAPKKTKIDERLSTADKKALDDLVTSRVAPR